MTDVIHPPRAADVGTGERLVERWPSARPFLVIGVVSIVAGGAVAAVARPTGFELGSWMAAYLVLVGGVAQIALGAGQAWMADEPPSGATVYAEVACWNLALGATIIGSLASAPVATAVGAVATVVALILFLRGVRHATPRVRWPLHLYRGLVAIVLVSAPIGLFLAWARHR